jgi:hypothetical protein
MRKNNGKLASAAACVIALAGSAASYAQSTTDKKGTPIAPAKPTPAQPVDPPKAEAAKASSTPAVSSQPATPAAQPASTPTAVRTSVRIEAVNGNVWVRASDSPDAPITLLKGGEMVTEGVEFQIGIKASVRIRVAEHQEYTFDQTGTIELRRALRDGDKNVTRINIKKGRVGFNVDSTKSNNDVKIETPEMILAVKGTIGAIEYLEGFGTRAFGAMDNTGRIELDYPATGAKAVMTRNESSDTQTPDPARNQNEVASADTPKCDSRDKY